MSDTTITAIVTAVFSIFGVKVLDVLASSRGKRTDELATIRANQEARIKALETKLEEKDREFDAYRDETNTKMNELRDQLREVRAENRELQAELSRYKAGQP